MSKRSYRSPLLDVFDFETRPGVAMIRPEIARRLDAACKQPAHPLDGIINFSVRPGVASVNPEIANALAEAAKEKP